MSLILVNVIIAMTAIGTILPIVIVVIRITRSRGVGLAPLVMVFERLTRACTVSGHSVPTSRARLLVISITIF